MYEHKVGKADYWLCKVEKDAKELVRTVMVAMRPRDAREKLLPYKSKKLKNLKLAVQRLVLICPAIEARNILKDGNKSCASSLNYCLSNDVKICEESNIDKPEAADRAAHDDTGDNTATAPHDDCLDL